VLGLSTRTTEYQKEMADRLRLPFHLPRDAEPEFAPVPGPPDFEADGMTLIDAAALILRGVKFEKVFRRVFPSYRSADEIVRRLEANQIPVTACS
jgi:peroxiredoxin